MASDLDSLRRLLQSQIRLLMEPRGWGLVLFLFSVVLTRGPEFVPTDMDDASSSLMASHGYCSQVCAAVGSSGKETCGWVG